ncbi:MAG: HAD-IA family hydrolase [Candidatus Paceibacterota bacterium]|nr:MAG: HAD-IA family hydrolase [Candidatus Paceibacterota bacterium]
MVAIDFLTNPVLLPYLNPFRALNERALQLLRPWEAHASVARIDPHTLYAQGIRGVSFDFDQTLAAYGSGVVDASLAPILSKWAHIFSGNVCVLSNAIGSRVSRAGAALDIPVIQARKRKPSVDGFRVAQRRWNLAPQQCVHIGDQVLTDILGANTAGWKSIHVRPFEPSADPWFIRVARAYERRLL